MLPRACGTVQRTAAAGLRPPPSAGLIDGAGLSVNAFGTQKEPEIGPRGPDKPLKRLNFRGAPGKA
ncbi:hypothetical protein ABIF38_001930 [Bradyrhizobium japonicum]|jgi:hypothetical protein|uniref:Uncharacterized protein n=1 Tax=Bradyrhizobium elkanii TaxID=29448 RepID=A0A8I1Y4L7_BRAEL|nr:hypothetical protein [Bradyrhizobium elkanii]MCS4009700.1 hypothetical protein [Bradyrhizobium elkanii USDA 61]MBP2430899.1 hypothetical protein [Bradyrhizobium elkanii]MCP1735755.1 hypothetical protein [Bradyrhizobium elkanii]MCP1753556.1 hypothetical protein [Bradyrhizobium elkanii]